MSLDVSGARERSHVPPRSQTLCLKRRAPLLTLKLALNSFKQAQSETRCRPQVVQLIAVVSSLEARAQPQWQPEKHQ